MPEVDLVALAATAPFVFAGSVGGAPARTGEVRQGAATAEVSVEQVWRTPPGLTLRDGQQVRVRLQSPLAPGRNAFFAELAAVTDELELLEHGHIDASTEAAGAAVADALQRAYAEQVGPRVAAAELVVLATVGSVETLTPPEGQDDESVSWASAPLDIRRVLKGARPRRSVMLIGPRRPSRAYPRAPAVREGREAVFLLSRPPEEALAADPTKTRSSLFFAADSVDIQPPDTADEIAALVGTGGETAG